MGWTTPYTPNPTDMMTASIWDVQVRDNLNLLKTSISDNGTVWSGTYDGGSITSSGLLTANGLGTHRLGKGGTGTTGAFLTLNGGSGDGSGAVVLFARNGNTESMIGTEKAILGGSSNGLLLYNSTADGIKLVTDNGSASIKFYTDSALRWTIDQNGGLTDGTITLNISGLYNTDWPTTTSGANANVADGDYIRLVTSLRSAKHDERFISIEEARRTVMGLRSVLYKSRVDADQRDWAGFVAEDVEAINPVLTTYEAKSNRLQSVAYDRIPAYLVPLLQDHESRIAALEARR